MKTLELTILLFLAYLIAGCAILYPKGTVITYENHALADRPLKTVWSPRYLDELHLEKEELTLRIICYLGDYGVPRGYKYSKEEKNLLRLKNMTERSLEILFTNYSKDPINLKLLDFNGHALSSSNIVVSPRGCIDSEALVHVGPIPQDGTPINYLLKYQVNGTIVQQQGELKRSRRTGTEVVIGGHEYRGRVVELRSGNPVAGARVYVTAPYGNRDTCYKEFIIGETWTDEDGYYYIKGNRRYYKPAAKDWYDEETSGRHIQVDHPKYMTPHGTFLTSKCALTNLTHRLAKNMSEIMRAEDAEK